MAALRCRPSFRSHPQRARSHRSWLSLSLQNVAVQGVEGAATLLRGGDLGSRIRRAENFAEAWAGGPAGLHLLSHVADFRLHGLGVLVAGLQLIGDLRRNS